MQNHLSRKEIGCFHKSVSDRMLDLVNNRGCECRVLDGSHIMLRAQDGTSLKVSGSRPVSRQNQYLDKFMREHTAPPPKRDTKSFPLFACTNNCGEAFPSVEAVNTHIAECVREHVPASGANLFAAAPSPEPVVSTPSKSGVMLVATDSLDETDRTVATKTAPAVPAPQTRTVTETRVMSRSKKGPRTKAARKPAAHRAPANDPAPEPETPPAPTGGVPDRAQTSTGPADEWTTYVYRRTRQESECFVTNGESVRCTAPGCDYTKQAPFGGIHLHERGHTGALKRDQEKGVAASRKKAASRRVGISEALTALAAHHGFTLVSKTDAAEMKKLAALRKENEQLTAKVEEQRREIEELVAKIGLIRDAMSL